MGSPTLNRDYQPVWSFGVYTCVACKKQYTVNDASTWNRCTPEHCHDCTLALDAARLETY